MDNTKIIRIPDFDANKTDRPSVLLGQMTEAISNAVGLIELYGVMFTETRNGKEYVVIDKSSVDSFSKSMDMGLRALRTLRDILAKLGL